jgi:hypothetical protein
MAQDDKQRKDAAEEFWYSPEATNFLLTTDI